MGIETLIMLGVGAAVGGGISKASGGSFWKGAALGAATGGIGVGIDRMTGGHVTGKKKDSQQVQNPAGNLSQQQQAISADSSEKARQMLISGNPQRLVASSGLSGNTSSGSSARRKLLGA
jgi:hypothetical protein